MSLATTIRRAIDGLYRPPFTRIFSPTVFRYAACGVLTLGVDAVCYTLIYHLIVAERFIDLGITVVSPYIASLALVFPITTLTGFWLHRNVSFASAPVPASGMGSAAGRPKVAWQLLRYLLSIGGALLFNYLCMKLLVEVYGFWPTPSKVVTSLLTALYSYLAARYFTFRGRLR